ncbi:MAG: two-component system sensor histidine kinase ArlS [Spirosomataceae bacterium]|jgi:signal transduction histidine kinase
MQIRTKIAIQFTIIVATILAIFSISIYYLSENYRQQEFYKSLQDRAVTTARLLIKEKEIDKKLLKLIDKNTLSTLYAVEVQVFNDKNEVAYSNYEADTIYYSPVQLQRIRSKGYLEYKYKDKQVVGVIIENELQNKYVVLAKAEDVYGEDKLNNIKNSMIIGLFSAILITVFFGFIFAGSSLKPIAVMNREISTINANNLTQKLNIGNGKDEIAQLATNFNSMLGRLEQSFELQKSFVSNASHELRTPLAAIKSEIQIALQKERSVDEYQNILRVLLGDNQRLIKVINGLLQLAKSEQIEADMQISEVRIDEIIFDVQDQLLQLYPDYNILIDFDEIPEEESFFKVLGNSQLLVTLFQNLIENACKYSDDHTAKVTLSYNATKAIIKVQDDGIGIAENELQRIFEPFYRSKVITNIKGHGIGLSICRKIVAMHKGVLKVQSLLGKGSTFEVTLSHIKKNPA